MKKLFTLLASGYLILAFAINAQAQKLSASLGSVSNVSCNAGSNGTATVNATGGAVPYTYSWTTSPTQTNATATGLSAGSYTVTVTDNAATTVTKSVSITQPTTLIYTTSTTNVSCYLAYNGESSVAGSGGTPPYTYYWAPVGGTTSTITSLGAGTLTLTLTDANGCTAQTSSTITQPPQLAVTYTTVASVASALVSGGTMPYTYSWYPGGSTNTFISGLSVGTYTVTVTDAHECSDSAIAFVVPSITYSLSTPSSDCNNGYVYVNILASSVPPYIFNNCVIDILYTGGEFSGDNVSNSGVGVGEILSNDPGGDNDYNILSVVSLPGDSIVEITFGDTTGRSTNGIELNAIPDPMLQIGLQIQNSCQTGKINFTNEASTSYYAEITKVFSHVDTTERDSIYNPHDCDPYDCDFYLCNEWCCNQDTNNICLDSCWDTCHHTCYHTCFDTMKLYTYDSIFDITSYKNVNYQQTNYIDPGVTSTGCQPTITNFNAPIDAGTDGILNINGSGFGNTQGAGQVKFYDADSGNYVARAMNAADYVSWTDIEIRIKLPAFVDSVFAIQTNNSSIGGGSFMVTTNACGSTVSGLNIHGYPFSVPYNIKQDWNTRSNLKTEILLRKADSNGGYVFRLDSNTFPHGSIKRLIFAKAMREWTCFTGMNWSIGADTTISTYNFHSNIRVGVNYVFFTDSLKRTTVGACQPWDKNDCGASDYIDELLEGDIYFNSGYPFIYDTTGTVTIPHGYDDFYGVCLHELGHFLQLNHSTDSTSLMYYRANYANYGPILPGNRLINLATPTTAAAVDGAVYSVNKSVNNLDDCSLYTHLIPLPRTCYNTTEINELPEKPSFVIYPNPSTGIVTIQSSLISGQWSVEVYNIFGQKVYSQLNIQNPIFSINLSNFASGIYFVQEQYPNGITTQKLIITKK